MSTEELAIGIDVGTSGVRALVCNREGKQRSLGSATTPAPLNRPAHWWQACLSALDQALAGIDAQTVVALAIDGTSGTLLGIDGSGRAVGDALMYNEGATDPSIHAHLTNCVPAGNPAASATSGLAKAIELQRREGVRQVLHQADWIAGMFSGDFSHSDENNALKTGYDPIERQWPGWLDAAGMPVALLPRVHPVATPVAAIDPQRLDPAFGHCAALTAKTVVITGTTDGCASFLATGASANGEAVTALGTTLTLKQLVSKPVFSTEYGVYSHRIGDLWLAGGASNTGGAVLDHFFSRDRLEALSAAIDTGKRLDLQYYPLLQAGERFPINDPALEPVMTPRPQDDSVFLQALFEGIAQIEKLGYQRVEALSGSPLLSVRSVGGGATNAKWSDLRRQILGVPFAPALSVQAAAGSARLAWQGFLRTADSTVN